MVDVTALVAGAVFWWAAERAKRRMVTATRDSIWSLQTA